MKAVCKRIITDSYAKWPYPNFEMSYGCGIVWMVWSVCGVAGTRRRRCGEGSIRAFLLPALCITPSQLHIKQAYQVSHWHLLCWHKLWIKRNWCPLLHLWRQTILRSVPLMKNWWLHIAPEQNKVAINSCFSLLDPPRAWISPHLSYAENTSEFVDYQYSDKERKRDRGRGDE